MDRQQPTAQIDGGALRLRPRSVERPTDAGLTLVGGIDDPAPARVDRGGLISPRGATWSLDWWVGADDRWYLPAREPSVRQRRHGPGPVIETSMRVPSGDVVATAYPVMIGSTRATVLEVENASPVPVVLAVALRPVTIDGRSVVAHRIELIDDPANPTASIAVNGRPAVLLPRTPNERVADSREDVFDRVVGGHDDLGWEAPVEGPGANAACLYPLPHRTTLRFVVPADDRWTDGGHAPTIRIDGLPPGHTVARGWASVIDRAGSFGCPDPGLTELIGAARARLMLAGPGLPDRIEALEHDAALVLEALALGGHGDECAASLDRLAETFPTRLPADTAAASGAVAGAATVRAAAAAAELAGPARADALLESAAQLTSLVDRRGEGPATAVARSGLARLADRAGQPDAARHLLASIGAEAAEASAADLDQVTTLARSAAPSGAWPPDDDAAAAARFLIAARSLLIDDHQGPDRAGAERSVIRLLPAMPVAWLGGEVEVHRAPAAGFRVSFAIRWHGYRPALLWEIHDAVDRPGAGEGRLATPLLSCPGLDPDWSTGERSGETLLAGTSTELPEAPAPGESFR